MSITRAGRPRLTTQRRPGTTARDEILDAAGELFTTLGYTGTSTRTIAEAVGIRQASLYHYFKTKDDILCALLSQTVSPTLSFIPGLRAARPRETGGGRFHDRGRDHHQSRWCPRGPSDVARPGWTCRCARRPVGP